MVRATENQRVHQGQGTITETREIRPGGDRAYETLSGARFALEIEHALVTDKARATRLMDQLDGQLPPSEYFRAPFDPATLVRRGAQIESLTRAFGDLPHPDASILAWGASKGVDPLLAFRVAYVAGAARGDDPLQIALQPPIGRERPWTKDECLAQFTAAQKALPASATPQKGRFAAIAATLGARGPDALITAGPQGGLATIEAVGRALRFSGWDEEAAAVWKAGAGIARTAGAMAAERALQDSRATAKARGTSR